MYFIDQCHQNGIGVISVGSWSLSKDGHGSLLMAPTFTNTLTMGEHKEWGTLVFNYSRHEVRISWFRCPVLV